jgi:mono/diheme cytochrome c family protein
MKWSMLNFPKWLRKSLRQRQRHRRPSAWVLIMLMGLSSLCGWGLTQVQPAVGQAPVAQATQSTIGTVDTVPANLKLSQETYLARCATCHIGIPPAVLPNDSWKAILQDSNHYGVTWEPLRNPDLALTWKYLQTNSRQLNPEEQVPYRIARSRYFKILHPRVKFTEPVTVGTCVSCHIGAPKFNFRALSPQWQDGP